ncbi:ELMO/CED-12 family [Carpediemonas membranifera]|uniref:ELMO/CED-12 family n=1 Tax=Carpediemonas membranifera TaxID=201153 RepID=A0A8J6AU10_9EUKA|nr:ELMO/CED-12 family [Carpediemonas membranifera]|eukprot:KAG9394621.1 ELMO/CED-12 family [Carpediemonas membranifera]
MSLLPFDLKFSPRPTPFISRAFATIRRLLGRLIPLLSAENSLIRSLVRSKLDIDDFVDMFILHMFRICPSLRSFDPFTPTSSWTTQLVIQQRLEIAMGRIKEAYMLMDSVHTNAVPLESNPTHDAMLSKLASVLAQYRTNGHPEATWEDIGFQRPDSPRTDFRQDGHLCLMLMVSVHWTMPDAFFAMIDAANTAVPAYPFALAFIHMVILLHMTMDRTPLLLRRAGAAEVIKIDTVVAPALVEMMSSFHSYWSAHPPSSLFGFNEVFHTWAQEFIYECFE